MNQGTASARAKIEHLVETDLSPEQMREQIQTITRRWVEIRDFREFSNLMTKNTKTAPELLPHVVLTVLFPRCKEAVLAGDEVVSPTNQKLLLLTRSFESCPHMMSCLYDWHPSAHDVWIPAIRDHVRIWNGDPCELCHSEG
jgi:hypothetical protein